MRDLQKYAKECIKDMETVGINVPKIEKFVVNTRAKKRFGQCCYNKKTKKYIIEISNDLLDERCPVIALKDTIFHEIIHTLPNCMNHGSEFKRYAKILNNAYGTNITRCSSMDEKYGKEYAETLRKRNNKSSSKKLYEVYCEYCGKIRASGYYQRMPKWYAHTESYKCGICHRQLTKVVGNYTLLSAEGVRN